MGIHHHPTHFFRSHQSSTLDFHFLSHYSYIKAHGFDWASLMMTWGHLGHYQGQLGDGLGMTWALLWQHLAKLWHTLAHSGILWHTLSYSFILLHTLTYSGILWHTLAYSFILLHTWAYSGILW